MLVATSGCNYADTLLGSIKPILNELITKCVAANGVLAAKKFRDELNFTIHDRGYGAFEIKCKETTWIDDYVSSRLDAYEIRLAWAKCEIARHAEEHLKLLREVDRTRPHWGGEIKFRLMKSSGEIYYVDGIDEHHRRYMSDRLPKVPERKYSIYYHGEQNHKMLFSITTIAGDWAIGPFHLFEPIPPFGNATPSWAE